MKHRKNKWRRYFNIILGIPNKKVRSTDVGSGISDRTEDPSCRVFSDIRNDEHVNWPMKTGFDNNEVLIQNCIVRQ